MCITVYGGKYSRKWKQIFEKQKGNMRDRQIIKEAIILKRDIYLVGI
jgi:hypothetical protein